MKEIPQDLIAKAAGGDMRAFEEIYRETSGYVYSIALRVTRNPADAEDVTQEAYIRVYRNMKGFGFRAAFKTWLYRITMNAALNACTRRSRDEARRSTDEDALDTVAAPEAAPQAEADERGAAVGKLLDMLSPDHRAVIVLREIEGLSYEEMADALHININTVRTRLKRARQTLLERGRKEVANDDL